MAVKPRLWWIRARAWPLDASWEPEHMQGLGVVHALLPVLRRQADLAAALRRHAAPFGCNLWLAPTLLGAMARLETDGRGDDAARLRDRLAGPLSGAGDLYVWRALRPACLTLALLGVLCGQPLAGGVTALLVHDAALLWRQGRGFRFGWARGDGLERDFPAALPPWRLGLWIQRVLLLTAGGLAAWGLVSGFRAAPSHAFLMSGALLVGYYAAQRQFPPGITFVALVWAASWLRRFSNPVGLP